MPFLESIVMSLSTVLQPGRGYKTFKRFTDIHSMSITIKPGDE
jgi:hypothetical protein